MRECRLVQQLQQQNPEALQSLIHTYQAYVGTIIRNITRSVLTENDVEELTADVFLAIWQTADKLQAGKVRPYLAAIARNKAKSRLRGQKALLPLEDTILLETADPDGRTKSRFVKKTCTVCKFDLVQSIAAKTASNKFGAVFLSPITHFPQKNHIFSTYVVSA